VLTTIRHAYVRVHVDIKNVFERPNRIFISSNQLMKYSLNISASLCYDYRHTSTMCHFKTLNNIV